MRDQSMWWEIDVAGNANVAGRSVASKVADVLIAVGGGRRSLTEVAHRADLPISTVHRLLKDLVAAGIVDRGSDGSYAIGNWLPLERDGGSLTALRDRASKVMSDLAVTTQRPVRLGIMSDNAVAFIERAAEQHLLGSFSRVRLPLHASALGKALLAHSPRPVIDSTVAAGLERFTERTIVSPEQLMAELMDVRRVGIATDWGESDVGHSAVAVAVTPVGGRIAALEIPATSMSDLAKVGPTLRIAARTLTRQLSDLPAAQSDANGSRGTVSHGARY